MLAKVIGLEHVRGTNDKGEYDFYVLHCTIEETRSEIEGVKTLQAFLPVDKVPYVQVGKECSLSVKYGAKGASVMFIQH